jgi:hypothetical protein
MQLYKFIIILFLFSCSVIELNDNPKWVSEPIDWYISKDVKNYYCETTDVPTCEKFEAFKEQVKEGFALWASYINNEERQFFQIHDELVDGNVHDPEDNTNIIYIVRENWEYDKNFVAYCEFKYTYKNGVKELMDADILLNLTRHYLFDPLISRRDEDIIYESKQLTARNYACYGQICDIFSIIAHETGHSVGISHSLEELPLMAPTVPLRRDLDDYDINSFLGLYY